MKTYRSKKGTLIVSILTAAIIIPLLLLGYDYQAVSTQPILFLLLSIPLLLSIWLYIDTSYHLSGNSFHYRSAFLRGKIDVSRIRKLENNKTMWAGIKPALATGGIIIHYNTYDRIYVAPENNEELINDLSRINPSIEIAG